MMPEVSVRRLVPLSAVVMLSLLGGCVSVPQPFRHDGTGGVPQAPTARLAIPLSTESGTDMAGAGVWQHAMVDAMLAQSVPAMAQATHPGDWWLKMTAEFHDGAVIPVYAVITPKGEERGHMNGAPVPAVRWQAKDGQATVRSAQEAAPGVADLLTGIRAAQMQKDPNSLKNRPAHVYFAGVHDAPGDGDRALARAFSAAFPDAHEDIRHSATGADYTVRCTVVLNNAVMTTSTTPQEHITLTWQVLDAQGHEAGSATQIHDIAAHSLDHQWGDVAVAAADEAAGAVRQIITRYSGRANVPLPADGVLPARQAAGPAQPTAGGSHPVVPVPAGGAPVADDRLAGHDVARAPTMVAAPVAPVVSHPAGVPVTAVAPAAPAPAAVPPPVVAPSPAVASGGDRHPAAVVAAPVAPVPPRPVVAAPVVPPTIPAVAAPAVVAPPVAAPSGVESSGARASVPAPAAAVPPAPAVQPPPRKPFPGVTLPPPRAGVTDRQRGAGVQVSPSLGR
ncbi:hypothetical protein [Komagataeibacter sp. FNDCR2]|uniref:hypothetical protein n=1 Tax=Komagataeibacter sp. FNDCR2 TaxID=2878682 RepID=UPI001E2E9F8C|nr:hypothetical protein [Komagataeibacter sp. FNDCR2]MCE2576100.1 hypothetical protein [Komagataeibacter sp. FNDCR2]